MKDRVVCLAPSVVSTVFGATAWVMSKDVLAFVAVVLGIVFSSILFGLQRSKTRLELQKIAHENCALCLAGRVQPGTWRCEVPAEFRPAGCPLGMNGRERRMDGNRSEKTALARRKTGNKGDPENGNR